MRNLLILLFLVLTLAACGGGGGGGDIPTLVPTIGSASGQGGAEGEGGAPRITPDNGLPPTWTPAPTTVPATPLPAAVDPSTPPPPAADGDSYTVQAGDTLAEIAARYNVTVAALAAANNIGNIDVIEVGQVLVIP